MTEQTAQQESELKPGLRQDSLAALIPLLKEKCTADRVAVEMRLLSKGLFIGETFLDTFTEVYQYWHLKQTGSHVFKSTDKCMKHFFGMQGPELFYLIEGKNCLVGFFIPCETNGFRPAGIAFFQGSLVPVSNSLHPRDPVLQSIPELNARLDPQKGLELSLSVRGRTYELSIDFLQQFVSVIQKSRRLSRDFPGAARGLRSSFSALVKILAIARAGRGRRKFLIPARYRSQPDRILIYRRLRLVLDEKQRLSHCYELRADNLDQFVKSETDLLRRNGRAARIGPFTVAQRDGPSVGFLRVRGKSYKFSVPAYLQFLSELLRMRMPPRELPAAYTLYDTFSLLGRVTQKGHWVPGRDIPKALYDTLQKHESVLQSRNWTFIVSLDTVQRVIFKQIIQ